MYSALIETIARIQQLEINKERQRSLTPLIAYLQEKLNLNSKININFICTHNSRRSHLCQIWAQIAATYYQIPKVYCYSGGTEETELFPKIIDTLHSLGLQIGTIAVGKNPIYVIKYDANESPIIGFSKKFTSVFNPQSEFVAVLTCSQADNDCPFIPGAEKRIPITYEDPKVSDNSEQQDEVYKKRSLEIASEMFYIFSKLK